MTRAMTLACVLAAGLMTPAGAQTTAAPRWSEGTHVVIVGQITSAPKNLLGVAHEHRMQVSVGPDRTDYTLNVGDADVTNDRGRSMAVSDLRSGWWVRATGTATDDPGRIRVTRVEVLGPDHRRFESSAAFRDRFADGYVMEVPRSGEANPVPQHLAEGTRVVVVGEITSQPRNAGIVVENKMQVGVGPDRLPYSLHLRKAEMLGQNGQTVHKSDLKDRMWVRAEGKVMDDPHRIEVTRLQVIARDTPDLRQSAFYRPGLDEGYVMAVAGSRQLYPDRADYRFSATPVTLVGKITDDTGPFNATRKITVSSAGNDWSLRVVEGANVLDDRGDKVSVHDLKTGQWVRVTGWQTGDLSLRAFRVEALRPMESFERSTFYRREEPNGYYERVTTTDTEPFRRRTLSGTVTAVNTDFGYLTVRDEQGQTHRVYTDLADIERDGHSVDTSTVRTGDRITVNGYLPEFPINTNEKR